MGCAADEALSALSRQSGVDTDFTERRTAWQPIQPESRARQRHDTRACRGAARLSREVVRMSYVLFSTGHAA